jgi:hypothetical protein
VGAAAVSLALSHTRRSKARTRYEEPLALATRLGMKIGAAAS